MNITLDDALRQFTRENCAAVNQSEIFLLLFHPDIMEEAAPLVQMGLAVYLGKPILIVAPRSMASRISSNLVRLAQGFETFPDGDREAMLAAVRRLMDGLKGKPS